MSKRVYNKKQFDSYILESKKAIESMQLLIDNKFLFESKEYDTAFDCIEKIHKHYSTICNEMLAR